MARVILKTDLGSIVLDINEEAAPNTAQNFLQYVNSGFYTDTIFHRVIDGFMIQGGGLTTDMAPKANNKPVTNEATNGLKNDVGTIAMARTMDPHSATSQFFINVKNNDFLNFRDQSPQGWGYCVFGKVADEDSLKVVMAISHVNTVNRGGHQDVPEVPVKIISAEVVSAPVMQPQV